MSRRGRLCSRTVGEGKTETQVFVRVILYLVVLVHSKAEAGILPQVIKYLTTVLIEYMIDTHRHSRMDGDTMTAFFTEEPLVIIL